MWFNSAPRLRDMVRSRRLELPRVAPLPPQGSASTNSAMTAVNQQRGGHVTDRLVLVKGGTCALLWLNRLRVLPVRIRLAEMQEIPVLLDVDEDAAQRFGADPKFAFVLACRPPETPPIETYVNRRRAFVAEVADVIQGYVLMGDVDGQAHIFQISVRMALQQRGIGRRLIGAGLDWARTQGYREVTLTTFRDAAWNGPAYRRLGFEPIERGLEKAEMAAILENERLVGLFREPRLGMRKKL